MGKGGKVECNLDLIFRIIELILLIVVVALFLSNGEQEILSGKHAADDCQGFDAMCISGSIYIIVLLILVCLQLFKNEEQDKKFVGVFSIIGAALMIATGIVVCIKAKNYNDNVLISGIMAIVGGAALIVDALKDFEVF